MTRFLLILMAFLTACADVSTPAKPNTEKKESVAPKKAKYPAALVFEGGPGSWSSPNPSDRKPYWRLHICLSKTAKSETKEGEVTINLKELATPFKRRGNSTGGPFVQHLNTVVIKYKYEAHFHKYDETFSYGLAKVETTSEQDWSQVSGPVADKRDLDIYSLKIDLNSLGQYQTVAYEEDDGSDMYLRFEYHRVTLAERAIEACENADSPYVLEILKK